MKSALVTGGSRGIGRAIVEKLAREGISVAFTYIRSRDKALELSRKLEATGLKALAIRCDLESEEDIEKTVDTALNEFGRIDILVNNAGYSSHYSLLELSLEEWDRSIRVNLTASFIFSKLVAPQMMERRWGRIINISSLRALTGSPHGPHYAAAKSGLIGLTKSLALILAPYNITVNAIAPGYTRTDMTREYIEKHIDELREKIPLKRVAEPHEVASLVAFLSSEEAGYITGQIISINGGIYM